MRRVWRSAPLSSYYRWLAERVREGNRETPQRFRPLAWRLAREPADLTRIWKLYGWILSYLAAEFREDRSRPEHLAGLVERARSLVNEQYHPEDMSAFRAEVVALTPYHRRRRSIHCHGQMASDRSLLVLRSMSPTLGGIASGASWVGGDDGALAWAIEMTLAYYVADYDHDHFVMTGPDVAERIWLIALWCQGNMPGDRVDSTRGRKR